MLVQRSLQKKEEMMRARRKAKADMKRAAKRNATNSAGSSPYKPPHGAPGGSAPASSENSDKRGDMNPLDWIPDDPLSDVGTAQMWDWHKDTPLAGLTPEDLEGELHVRRLGGDNDSVDDFDYREDIHALVGGDDVLQNPIEGEDEKSANVDALKYKEGDEQHKSDSLSHSKPGSRGTEGQMEGPSRSTSAKNRITMKELASSVPTLPTIDAKQKSVLAPSGKNPKKLPAKLANSPFAAASSKSRPVLPVCKGSIQLEPKDEKK